MSLSRASCLWSKKLSQASIEVVMPFAPVLTTEKFSAELLFLLNIHNAACYSVIPLGIMNFCLGIEVLKDILG